jgi:hypothetical protein
MADQICGERKSGLAWQASPEEDSKMLAFTRYKHACRLISQPANATAGGLFPQKRPYENIPLPDYC